MLALQERSSKQAVHLAADLTEYVRSVSDSAGIAEDEVTMGLPS